MFAEEASDAEEIALKLVKDDPDYHLGETYDVDIAAISEEEDETTLTIVDSNEDDFMDWKELNE